MFAQRDIIPAYRRSGRGVALRESGNAASSKACILVVEDDRASRSALMQLLRLTGFDPISAGSIAEALDQLARGPRCLILDLMLPDGNGSALLRHIRENDLPIQVAVTTGAIEWEKMLHDSPAPPDAIFPKPVDFHRLIDWLGSNCTL